MQRWHAWRLLPFLFLTGLVLLAYGEAVDNGYVWDDRYFLVDFGWLDSVSAAWRTAFSPLFMSEAYVRPLPLLSLYADNLAGEHRAAVSHAVNIGIHVLCSWLVFGLARDAARRRFASDAAVAWAPLVLAALFAVHPALTEAVIWVSSRFDLMATLFMLTGLWVATRDRISDGWLALALAVLFFLAAMSKELAVVFPALLAVFVVLRDASGGMPSLRPLTARRWLLVFMSLFIAGCGYVALRHQVLSGGTGIRWSTYDTEQFARTCATIARYLKLTFLPFAGNSPQHSFIWSNESGLRAFAPQVIVSALLVVVSLSLLIRRRSLGLVLLAWSIGYVLVIHLIPINIGNNSAQQRFMYLPTAVLLSLLPYGAPRLSLSTSARWFGCILLGVWLTASIIVVRSVVPAWKADITLWTWARQIDPGSVMARENLIWAYLDSSMYEQLDKEVELLRQDRITTSLNVPLNVGVSYFNRGQFEQAISYYEFALTQIHTGTPMQQAALYSNMAAVFALVGRDGEAASAISKAVRADPHNHVALANMFAFCASENIDRSAWDPLTVRRAVARVDLMVGLLQRYRKDGDTSALCPIGGAR